MQCCVYGAGTSTMGVAERKILSVMEMRCLKGISGGTSMDQVRIKEMQRRTGEINGEQL